MGVVSGANWIWCGLCRAVWVGIGYGAVYVGLYGLCSAMVVDMMERKRVWREKGVCAFRLFLFLWALALWCGGGGGRGAHSVRR